MWCFVVFFEYIYIVLFYRIIGLFLPPKPNHSTCWGRSWGSGDPSMTSRYRFQVKIQAQNEEMLHTACQQFMGKSEAEIRKIAMETLEGHQRAIMGCMTVEVLRRCPHRLIFLLPAGGAFSLCCLNTKQAR